MLSLSLCLDKVFLGLQYGVTWSGLNKEWRKKGKERKGGESLSLSLCLDKYFLALQYGVTWSRGFSRFAAKICAWRFLTGRNK